jgi:deoxyribonuclease IV
VVIGAHVKTAGGVQNAFKNAEEIGAKCIQIFGASPRQWKSSLPSQETIEEFLKEKSRSGISQVFLHASYLVNLATPDDELYEKSISSLSTHLQIANLLEAEGLVFHLGSSKNSTKPEAYKRQVKGMLKTLENAPGRANLIMENSSGGGSKLGTTIEGIGEMFRAANNPRIKVCIDTAHSFGAGLLETFTPKELTTFTEKCDKAFGLENITVLHINDSKVPFDSKKDRHENLGQGLIGLQAFKNLSKTPHLKDLPWILEVPGLEGNGPDQPNIKVLELL